MRFTPGPGLGGHCIPVDPHYLSWKMRTLDYRTRFIELASEINAEMPHFMVGKVRQALNGEKKAVNGSRVLVLGVAYKKDIDDIRESPALEIIKDLERERAEVHFHDPYIESFEEDGRLWKGVPLTDEVLESADAVIIVTDHSSLDFDRILARSNVLVDSRNATAALAGQAAGGRAPRWIVKGREVSY
jgi:UDP-N-acetyl-D-glucosamine dehydrogenase